jgi:DNA-binding response OmpR family regulator
VIESPELAGLRENVQNSLMSSGRILVVEDEPLIRMFVVDTLEDAGFGVEEAGSATEALAKVGSESPLFAAVIVDVGLPDRPGDSLAAELRTKWADLPIIIASGQDKAALRARFKDDGRVGVLGKPYNSAMLKDALRELGVTAVSG